MKSLKTFLILFYKDIKRIRRANERIEILIVNETDEIIEDLFDSLLIDLLILSQYQKGLEEQMKGSEFIFDNVDSLYYKLHKISLNRGGSHIDSPEY